MTARTDRERAEALAALLYPGSTCHLWRESGTSVRVLAYTAETSHRCGSGTDEADAWRVAAITLRARAIALRDDLTRELETP